jgi:hypothetical protein
MTDRQAFPVYESDSSESERTDGEEPPGCADPLLKSTLWQDLQVAIYESRFMTLFAVAFGLYVGYVVTISPYQVSRPALTMEQRSLETLVRRITIVFIWFSCLHCEISHRNI